MDAAGAGGRERAKAAVLGGRSARGRRPCCRPRYSAATGSTIPSAVERPLPLWGGAPTAALGSGVDEAYTSAVIGCHRAIASDASAVSGKSVG